MSDLPTAFHIVDQYLDGHGSGCNNTPVKRITELIFGRVLDFDSAMRIKGPIFCSATTLQGPQKTMSRWIPRLEALAEFKYPLLGATRAHTPMLPGQMWAEMPRCFDTVFAYSPQNCPYPALRWYCPWPHETGIERREPLRSFAERKYTLCYIGKPASSKQVPLIAALLEENPLDAVIVIGHPGRPPEGMGIYRVMRTYEIPCLNNPSRAIIGEIFNTARFLAYPTHQGVYKCATLEQSVLEAIYCGCAPILNSAWCTGRYRGYPAQVNCEGSCWGLDLTEDLYHACLDFMDGVNALSYNCRTFDEMRADITSGEYHVDPERPRRCHDVIDFLRRGGQLQKRNYNHGPFYVIPSPRNFDYHETYTLE